jgi:hypothetical protein
LSGLREYLGQLLQPGLGTQPTCTRPGCRAGRGPRASVPRAEDQCLRRTGHRSGGFRAGQWRQLEAGQQAVARVQKASSALTVPPNCARLANPIHHDATLQPGKGHPAVDVQLIQGGKPMRKRFIRPPATRSPWLAVFGTMQQRVDRHPPLFAPRLALQAKPLAGDAHLHRIHRHLGQCRRLTKSPRLINQRPLSRSATSPWAWARLSWGTTALSTSALAVLPLTQVWPGNTLM